jgi:Flp pilus assembly protein TadG
MRLIRGPGNQRGTSTLEFVVVLPTLLLIFLAALELSRAWLTVNIMTNAAREGARWGAVTETFDPGGAMLRMTEILDAANLTAAPAPAPPTEVTCPAACARDSQVTASVTVNFVPVAPAILWMLANPLELTQTAIMRRE